MIASTKHKKINNWDDFSFCIWFNIEGGRVTEVECVEFSKFGTSPKFKFNAEGTLIEVDAYGEGFYLTEALLKDYRETAIEQLNAFKEDHLQGCCSGQAK